MVASSPQALAEILGVSAPPTPPLATSGNPTPGTLTPISDDLIKTSSMSVADYFKEKMRAKLASSSALKPTAEESREDPSVAADIQTSPDGNSSRREEIDQEPGVPTCDVEAKKKRKKSKRSREPAEEGIPSVETSRVEDDETERRERKRRKKEEKKLKKSKDEKGRANEDSD
jgi:Pin2-interacting protein X1